MDFDQAKADVIQWITDFVERPHPALSGWPPCPHARRARSENRLDLRVGVDPYTDLQKTEMGAFDVIAFVYDPKNFPANEFEQDIQAANRAFLLAKNMIALGDHPALSEQVNGVIMNQGQWALIFVQDLGKLDQAARSLANRGYYHGWPEQYLQDLFQHRQDPRS